MILLDTNVLSELVRQAPAPAVLTYLKSIAPGLLFTAAVCEAELHYGLALMPASRKRDELTARIELLLANGFRGQILPFDHACAAIYGAIRSHRRATGRPIQVEDAMIAATAFAHNATVATRNTSDFMDCRVTVFDPWAYRPEK